MNIKEMMQMAKLKCTAVIPFQRERETIRDQFVRRFATVVEDPVNPEQLIAEYEGYNESIIDAIIQTFERYPDHEIVLNR